MNCNNLEIEIRDRVLQIYTKYKTVPRYLIIGRDKFDSLYKELKRNYHNTSSDKFTFHTQFGTLKMLMVESDILEIVCEPDKQLLMMVT